MADVETAIVTHLVAANLVAANKAFKGPVRDDPNLPNDAVFVLQTSGFKLPNAYMNTSRASWRPMRANIAVRGPHEAYTTTRDLADNIWKQLQANDLTGFLGMLNGTAAPQYQGKDRQQRDIFMVYVDVLIKE